MEAEDEVRENGPDPDVLLIQPHELHQIRQLWIHEEGDWEDSLPQIYNQIRGEDLEWIKDDLSGLGGEEKSILNGVCEEHDLPPGMLIELIDLEKKLQGLARRSKVYIGIDSILSKDWTTREDALAQTELNSNQISKMLLKSVSFKDYCLYAGEQKFQLAPNGKNGDKKPVVLFGGKNGAGKTTLLDALRLGLYGKQSFEGTISETQYKDELRSRIHIPRNGTEAPRGAKISIEFDLASQGQTNSYRIERIWDLKEEKIDNVYDNKR